MCGMIGAGKTTLAEKLSKVMGLPIYYEEVIENEYLEDFYRDMNKYAFSLQIYLLNRRFKQQQQIIWQGRGGIQDRSIYEDIVFVNMLKDSGFMEERDVKTYKDLFINISKFMPRPNIIVFLDVTPKISYDRIVMRNRGMEVNGITLEYLEKLYNSYHNFIYDISKIIPVIRIDWTCFRDEEEVAVKIKEEYEKIQIIHDIEWK